MAFSVGILYSAKQLLDFARHAPVRAAEFPHLFDRFGVASAEHVLQVAQDGNWIRVSSDGRILLTPAGEEIAAASEPDAALRLQLRHLILGLRPSWSALLCRGRAEATRYMPADVVQCFQEAGLLDAVTDDIVEWWDSLSLAARGMLQDAALDTGRRGERLSIEYERKRTGRDPHWQAIESNRSGFDLLSVVSRTDNRPLRIEVKASEAKPANAEFFITRNEWSVAETSKSYLFHLWTLRPSPRLFVLKPSRLSRHLPVDKGQGQWQEAKVPFQVAESDSD